MSYIPTEWHDGDIVTAEKLNKLENGIANVESGGIFLINAVHREGQEGWFADKTMSEMIEAYQNGMRLILRYGDQDETFIDASEIGLSSVDYDLSEQSGYIYFIAVTVSVSEVTGTLYKIDESGSIDITVTSYNS